MRRRHLNDLPSLPELPSGLILREYRDGDLDYLAEVLREAFQDEKWTTEETRLRLIDAPEVKKTFVIEDSGRAVATTSARIDPERFPESGYVHWVAVKPEFQGRNLGYILTLAALHAFVAMGCKDAVLETDDHRLAAIKIYKSLGFEPEHHNDIHIDRWAKVTADLLASVNL